MDRVALIPEPERRELRAKGVVSLFGDIDVVVAHDFIEDLQIAVDSGFKEVVVMISSNGGEVDSGISCIRAIRKAQKSGVTVIGSVFGYAMSMAFLILQCCDVRKMGDLCTLMAHGVLTVSVGDIKNRDEETKLLKFWQGRFAEIVANRCKDPKYGVNYWKRVLADQTPKYFNSEESIEIGLIDEVE